jgi:pimeloyl-ACP methyl ester carboxylesterase
LPPNLDEDKPTEGALQLLFFEPAPVWEKVRVPVLLVWGDKDTVVPVEESKTIILNVLKKGRNADVTVKIFENVNHGVVLVNTNKTWDFPRVDLNYYDAIVQWTKNKLNAKAQVTPKAQRDFN